MEPCGYGIQLITIKIANKPSAKQYFASQKVYFSVFNFDCTKKSAAIQLADLLGSVRQRQLQEVITCLDGFLVVISVPISCATGSLIRTTVAGIPTTVA